MDTKVREEARKAARDRGIHAALIADNDVLGAEQIGRAAANAAIDAYEAALKAAGYVMVPREATPEMCEGLVYHENDAERLKLGRQIWANILRSHDRSSH